MAEYEARVAFHDMQDSAVDALLSISEGQLAIEVSGRPVGRWYIEDLSPRLSGETVVVTAEGEQLVIDVADPDSLRVSLQIPEAGASSSSRSETYTLDTHVPSDDKDQSTSGPLGVGQAHSKAPGTSDGAESSAAASGEGVRTDVHQAARAGGSAAQSLQDEILSLEQALTAAEAQLRWVQELVPRRLPMPVREGEAGLGVVQGVRLKERRPLPGADGLQPWVVVDTGNVYVTTMRLIFSGAQDVEFEFDDIDKKGASSTGLLLGVSSRIQSHILEGPGERLAVVLTAAEKIAKGVDPTAPFKEAIVRLTSEIQDAEGRLESAADAPSAIEPASAV